MKVRLQKGSITIRLLEEEIYTLQHNHQLTEHFGWPSVFPLKGFVLELHESADISTRADQGYIYIYLPAAVIKRWQGKHYDSLRDVVAVSEGLPLSLLIEKDLLPKKGRE